MKKIIQVFLALTLSALMAFSNIVLVYAASVAQVKSLKAKTVTYNSVTLSWKKVSGAKYYVEQSTGKKWKVIKKDLKTNKLTVKKLTSGTKYKFRVRAKKGSSYGKYSKTLTVTPKPAKVKASVSSVTATSAKLKWSKVSGASGYYVQKKDGKKWKKVATVKAKTTSYTVKKLTLGKTYTYRVVAYRTVGKKKVQGTPSSSLTVKPALGQTKSLKATAVTPSTASLSWGKVSSAEGYEIQVKNGDEWEKLTAVKGTTKAVISIAPNKDYEIRVRAYKGKNYGKASESITVTYTLFAASELKASSVSKESATLTWTKAEGVDGYEVQLLENGSYKTVKITTENTYTHAIVPQTEYSFRVVSYVKAGDKAYSGNPTDTVKVSYAVNAASNLKGSASGNTTALTWTAASGVTGYEVQVLNSSKWETVLTTEETKASVSTEPGKEYSFRVVSFVTVNGTKYYGGATSTVKTKYTIASAKSLKVSSTTKEGATLTWTAASGVTGYEVQRQNGSSWETAATVNGTTATIPMEAGIQYSFRVVSFVTFDGKNYYGSATSTVRAKYTVNAASSLKASGTTKNSTSLSWRAASGVDGYEVQRLNGNTWVKVADTTSNSVTVACIPGEYNSYRVLSYVKVGDKVLYGNATSTVRTKYTIKNPSSLSLGTVTKDTASLSWKAADGIDGYEIQKQVNGNWVKHATSGTNSATVAIEPGVSYTFRVVAYITVEGANYYSSATGNVTAKYNIAAASGLKTASLSATSATLAWNAAADATSYEVQIYNGSGWSVLTKVSATSTNVSIVPDTTYKYRVISVITLNGKDYKGASSNELSVKYTVPAPAGAKVTAANEGSVTLGWNAVSGAESYIVYNGSNAVATVKTTSAVISGLTKATSYSFTVKATQNINGKAYYSAASNTVSARTTPDAVTGLSVSGYTETSASLKWNAAKGADGYIIYRGSGKLTTVTGTTYTATGLTGNTAYTFKVVPYHNVNGFELQGAASNTATVTTYFDTVENLTITDINTNYAIVKADWNKIEGATYKAYTKNTVNTEWVQVNEGNESRDYYYLKGQEYDMGLKASESNYKINASWNSVSGASKYVLQTRTNGSTGAWTTVAETKSTSASFIIAPSTSYTLRVVAYNGSFKVCALKGELATDFAEISNIPGVVSTEFTLKTNAAPAFNANDKNIKTAYVLKAVQAINNTKAEKTIKRMTKTELIETEVGSLEVKAGALTLWSWWDISKLLSDEQMNELAGVEEELNVKETYTGTVTGGTFVQDGQTTGTALTKMISPYSGDAYLYKAEDVNNINNKISGITYSKSGSTETIVLTLAQEVATRSNDVTPVHKGLYEDFSGTASAQGMDDGRVTVGPTKITLVINENGTLNSMTVNTTFEMYSQMTEEGISFRMTVRGKNVQDTYTFTR